VLANVRMSLLDREALVDPTGRPLGLFATGSMAPPGLGSFWGGSVAARTLLGVAIIKLEARAEVEVGVGGLVRRLGAWKAANSLYLAS
jgi:hypothetical protein